MAITIRNRRTEALIREIGRHTGEGPSAVITRAVENLGKPAGAQDKADFDARFAALMRLAPPRDPKLTWKDVETEMNSIF